MMRFSKLRKSRLTMALVAFAWLPYMTVWCVVSPFDDSSGAKPNCHILAGLLPTSAEARTDSAHSEDHAAHHGAHHGAVSDDGDSETSRNDSPIQTCCDLTGKSNVTIEKIVDFGAPLAIVAVALTLPQPAVPQRILSTSTRVDVRDHSPPLYLSYASFLI